MVHARHAVASILRAAYGAAVARESRTRLAASAGALVLTASLSWGPQAHAQQAPASSSGNQEQTQQLQEVEVTGSRIKRTSDFSTPTPTTVLDTTTMENAGVVNVGQALQMAPANLSSFTPANTGNSSFFTGSYIPNLRGLNSFFGTRTLTLIDTQRAVQTNQGDSFDLNFVPQILVQRIDTVTGGASAAYGSGAIAGVINIILDRQLEGGRIDGDIYQTNASDGRDRHLGAAYGFGLADNRVHVVLGGEYEKQDGVGCEEARSWCSRNESFYQSGVTPGGNVATYSLGSNVRSAAMSANGVLTPSTEVPGPFGPSYYNFLSAQQGRLNPMYQATPDGTGIVPYQAGATPFAPYPTTSASYAPTAASTVEGGQGDAVNQYTQLMPPTTRGVLSALITAKLTDNTNLKVDLNWGKVESTAVAIGNETTSSSSTPYYLYSANPYINCGAYGGGTATVNGSTVCADGSGNPYMLNKDWNSQVPLTAYTSTTLKRVTAGLDGVYGDSSWTWNGYAEYGLTEREQLESNELRNAAFGDALSGCTTGVSFDGSAPIADPGCVAINPLGTQPLTSAQLGYAFGNLEELLRYEQTVVAFNSTGNIFQGIGAGAWSLAAGAEWRQEVGHNDDNNTLGTGCETETYTYTATTPVTCSERSQDFGQQFGTSFAGMTTVEEGYLELNLPLLKDLPFAHLLDLDIAGRESHYESSMLQGIAVTAYDESPQDFTQPPITEATHNLNTFKFSLAYEPIEGVRIRASQSRDARAPDFREMYYGQQLQQGSAYGFCAAPGQGIGSLLGNPCTINLFGNTNLQPETSNTTTAGIVLTPTQVPGLQFSADWIHVRISNAISAAAFNFTEDQVVAAGGAGTSSGSITWNTAACGSAANCMKDWLGGGTSDVLAVNSTAFNGAYYDERAVDFSLNYLIPTLPDGSSLSFRALATWTGEQTYQNYQGGQVFNLLGQLGGNALLNDYTPAPRWRGNMSVTWTKGILSLTPMVDWVGHGTLLDNGVTPSQTGLYNYVASGAAAAAGQEYVLLPFNYVPSYFKFDMNATLDFGNIGNLKDVQVYTQVNNLLNKAPPFAAAPSGGLFGTGGYAGTNPVLYDTLGLAYRVGFRVAF